MVWFWEWYNIFNLQCKEYFENVQRLQTITIANADDDDTNNAIKSCFKYFQQSHEQYDLSSLFILDNPKIDNQQSDDATIKLQLHGVLQTHNYLHGLCTKCPLYTNESIIVQCRTNSSIKQHVKIDFMLFQNCFNIVVCLVEYAI